MKQKLRSVSLKLEPQKHVHMIAEIGRHLREMHQNHRVFVEPDSAHRAALFTVTGDAPELFGRAEGHIQNLKVLMHRSRHRVVSNEDLIDLIQEAEGYSQDLEKMYMDVQNSISSRPAIKSHGWFRKELFRRRITHRFLYQRRLSAQP